MAAKIGALNVHLDLDAARFDKKINQSHSKLGKLGKSFSKFATGMATAFAGVTALGVGLNRIFGDLASEAKGLDNQARLAGEGFEEFQRKAFAAKSVGIEYEKLGDIFKDTRDKIGDFLSTGGGEMADFFENIAPKVGITADAFKNLSGSQGLQLYYNSLKKAGLGQNEIVFYMEAIADEASGLIPLLDRNGAAFDRLGDKAAVFTPEQLEQLRRYEDAQMQVENATKRVTLALVDAGLVDAMADLGVKLGAAIEGFTGVEASASLTNEELEKTEPARKFGEQLRGISDSLQQMADDFDDFNARNAANTRDTWRKLGEGFSNWTETMNRGGRIIGEAIARMASESVASVRRMVSEIGTAITGRLSAIWEGAKAKIEQVRKAFFDLWDKVTRRSYVPDMVDDIAAEMQRLDQVMVAQAEKATDATKAAFRTMAADVRLLMDRLFPESAALRQYRDDMALLAQATAQLALPADQAAQAYARLQRELAGVSIDGRFEKPTVVGDVEPTGIDQQSDLERLGAAISAQLGLLKQGAIDFARVGRSAFESVAYQMEGFLLGAQSAGDAIRNLVKELASMALQAFVFAPLRASLGIPGFASGTASAPRGLALVGERGPELVNFNGGERVYNNRETRGIIGGGATTFNITVGAGMTDDAARRTGTQIASAAQRRFAMARRTGMAG